MRDSHNNISLAPTDLSNFLSCRHLSKLDLNVAKGLAERPVRYGPFIDDLKARGIAHEEAYLHLGSWLRTGRSEAVQLGALALDLQ